KETLKRSAPTMRLVEFQSARINVTNNRQFLTPNSMYNLSVLNSTDFEYLAKDVLEYEFGVPFQIFKKGWDKGVDLRYSCNSENNIVVQAKHYLGTPYTGLIKVLKEEKNKVAGLAKV